MNCPCHSNLDYNQCCKPYITGEKNAPTAEALMRSRYTAYTEANIEYLKKTLAPESRSDFDAASTKKWAQSAKWKNLQIVSVDKGTATDSKGKVEFIATYEFEGEGLDHHEVSDFRKTESGEWFFVDGDAHTHKEGEPHGHHHEKPQTVVREQPKVGRNEACACGSGKKYKKCCGAA